MEETLKELTLMVRAIYDQQLVMNAKMDGLEKRVSNMEDLLDQVERRTDSIDLKMDKLEGKIDQFDSRLNQVELTMDVLGNQMQTHQQFLELLKQSQTKGLGQLDRMESLLGQKVIRLEQESIDTQERLKYIRTVLVRHDEEIIALGLKRTV